jgi:hypothetical protein
MFLCEHSWDPPGANFAIFQCCIHCFQCIEANIQLRTQFPSRNPLIRADELIQLFLVSFYSIKELLFILWCGSCAWPSGTWFVSQVTVATATASLCYHPLFSLRKCSASVDECHLMQFFPHGGIHLHPIASYRLPCQTAFCKTTPLLSSVTRQQNLTEYWQECSTSTAISPTSASDVESQHNKIGVLNFGATLVDLMMA